MTNTGTTLSFDLPSGWTIRKVASAMAREWLPPFRAVPVVKGAPWMVQPVMEESGDTGIPLWEPGISTQDYEERLDRADLRWTIRAKAGRSKGTVLARLSMSTENPQTFEMVCSQEVLPDTLFDAEKVAQFLEARGAEGTEGLLAGLLLNNGIRRASV